MNATTADGARQEAANFARAIDSAGGRLDLPPVMDYENNPKGLTPAQISEVAHAFWMKWRGLPGVSQSYTRAMFLLPSLILHFLCINCG